MTGISGIGSWQNFQAVFPQQFFPKSPIKTLGCSQNKTTETKVSNTQTLAALSSSRSLVVCPSVSWSVRPLVGWSVGHSCEKVTFRVLKGNLNLPSYLGIASDSSDSSDSSDGSNKKLCLLKFCH